MTDCGSALRDTLETRTNALLLMRRLFEGELDRKTADALVATGAAGALARLAQGGESADEAGAEQGALEATAELLSRALSDEDLDNLRNEYLRMFVGPGKPLAPFWESVYLDDRELLFLESTADVRRAYESEGLQVKAASGREAEDALPHELDFLAHLSRRTIEAIDQGDEDEVSRLVDVQLEFERRHLADWLPAFAARAQRVRDGLLYPQLCAAADEFARGDIAFLEKLRGTIPAQG